MPPHALDMVVPTDHTPTCDGSPPSLPAAPVRVGPPTCDRSPRPAARRHVERAVRIVCGGVGTAAVAPLPRTRFGAQPGRGGTRGAGDVAGGVIGGCRRGRHIGSGWRDPIRDTKNLLYGHRSGPRKYLSHKAMVPLLSHCRLFQVAMSQLSGMDKFRPSPATSDRNGV